MEPYREPGELPDHIDRIFAASDSIVHELFNRFITLDLEESPNGKIQINLEITAQD